MAFWEHQGASEDPRTADHYFWTPLTSGTHPTDTTQVILGREEFVCRGSDKNCIVAGMGTSPLQNFLLPSLLVQVPNSSLTSPGNPPTIHNYSHLFFKTFLFSEWCE